MSSFKICEGLVEKSIGNGCSECFLAFVLRYPQISLQTPWQSAGDSLPLAWELFFLQLCRNNEE